MPGWPIDPGNDHGEPDDRSKPARSFVVPLRRLDGGRCVGLYSIADEEDKMTAKELIQAEIGTLDESDLNELYGVIKSFVESKKRAAPPSLMSKLKRVKIDAPTDFAAHAGGFSSPHA